MKQFCTLLLLLPLVFGSCDKDDDTRIETWTVASEKGVAGIFMGFGHVPASILKTGPNAGWEISTAHIEGFTFEKGYQTEMLVRIEPIPNPPADGPGYRYTMERPISRTPMQSNVDPLQFSPEFEVTIASRRATVRRRAVIGSKTCAAPTRVGNRSRGRSKASISNRASRPASGYGPSPNTTKKRTTTK